MTHVWYVAYGSNLSLDRLTCYVAGGCPPGGTRAHPGARDRTPPARSVPVELPGTTYFAGRSEQWGGGVAYYDHLTPGRTAARAYLVTAGQFADIAAQEMHREPRADDPLEQLVLAPLHEGRHEVGPGSYETVVDVGRHEDRPMLTFTAPGTAHRVERSRPSRPYLDTMARGLREAHGWGHDLAHRYLADLQRVAPGLSG